METPAARFRVDGSEAAALWSRSTASFAARQLALWASLYTVYLLIREVALASPGAAFDHAFQVVSLERTLGIFHEGVTQSALSDVGALKSFFNAYYMGGFGPLLIGLLVWFAWRRRDAYFTLRKLMLVSLALATIGYFLYPTAPPRLVPGLGIADTVGLGSHDTGTFLGIRFNQYAAVPSMHVGWSILLAAVAFRYFRRRSVRILFLLHPLLMATAVTATGNHYFLDSLAGVVPATVALALVSSRFERASRGALSTVLVPPSRLKGAVAGSRVVLAVRATGAGWRCAAAAALRVRSMVSDCITPTLSVPPSRSPDSPRPST